MKPEYLSGGHCFLALCVSHCKKPIFHMPETNYWPDHSLKRKMNCA
jgi:hypothetical protein